MTLTIWVHLTGYSVYFDRLSKSKTIENLTPLIHPDDLSEFFNLSENHIVTKGSSNGDRKWWADQQITVLRQHLTTLLGQQRPCLADFINFLCEFGFFTTDRVDKEYQKMLREKLFSALSILIADTSDVWPTIAVLKIESLEDDHKKVVKLDSQIKRIRKEGLKSMKALRKLV